MKPRKPSKPRKHRPRPDGEPLDAQSSDARSIDALYGLEPVFDPSVFADDGNPAGGVQFHSVECPYCGESFETSVDTSSGSARYVEDCQVCCQPIEFSVEIDHAGVLRSLSTSRND